MKRAILVATTAVLLSCGAARARANLVVDGGFESATRGPTSGSLGDGAWNATQGTIQVLDDTSATAPGSANSGINSVQLTYGNSLNACSRRPW